MLMRRPNSYLHLFRNSYQQYIVDNYLKVEHRFLPGKIEEYRSIDYIDQSDYHTNFYPTEYLNTLTFSGLPPHILKLKLGQPVILLRADQAYHKAYHKGLCNGT